jgi:chemotaxis protein methyltransferase CheR
MHQSHNIEEFTNLVGLIHLRTGLTVSDTKIDDVAQAIKKLMLARRLSSISALMATLNNMGTADPLWQELVEIITVGETYFFRNEAQFEALRSEVFPALIAKRRESRNKYLRLWCAGCATGEEPYSLAILLRELIPDYQSWQITLLATDINSASLEHAQRGVYRSWSFRSETPDQVKRRWFEAKGETYKLADAIKHMVTFRSLNLVSDEYPSFDSGIAHMDLIMCRNVTIYFNQETTLKIARQFYETLSNNGWLVVGHSEPMSSIYADFTPRNFPNTIIYHKSQSEAVQAQPAPIAEPVQPKFEIALPKVRRTIEWEPPVPEPQVTDPQATEPAPEPTWQKAKTAADLEQWQDALILLAKAETENKFQPQVFYLRAMIQIQLDDLTGAHASLRQALFCDSQFVLAHYTLGELHEAAGEFMNATHHWKAALKAMKNLKPDSHLPFGEDLTVEMLQGLITHSLQRITHRTKGAN